MASNNIKDTLDKHGKSQIDLSGASNVSVPYINKVCSKKVTPALKTQHKLVNGINDLTGKSYELGELFY